MTDTVTLITDGLTPYRIPLFNVLHQRLAELGYELRVICGFTMSVRRMWKVDYKNCKFKLTILEPGTAKALNGVTSPSYRGLLRQVSQKKPNCIVVSGFSWATLKLWLRSFFLPTPYIIWAGSTLKKGKLDSPLRVLLRKLLIRHAAGFIAYGIKAKEYFVTLGAPEEKVYIAVNTVDTHFFREQTEQFRAECPAARTQKYLTYIGYLTPRKNVFRVLEAVRLLANRRCDFVLDIVGDGEDRKRLEAFVARHGIENYVQFHGFKQKCEVPAFLARSQCFLFQTDFDIWGLVLNEAMAAGLPCIASVHAGATHDLIENGVTGFVIDFADTEAVVDRINWILDHPHDASKLGQRAQAFIAQHASLEKSTDGFIKAILAR